MREAWGEGLDGWIEVVEKGYIGTAGGIGYRARNASGQLEVQFGGDNVRETL
jgi:hypothetical protein